MDRRNFISGLAGILASGFAPASVASGVLMPVRRIVVPYTYSISPRAPLCLIMEDAWEDITVPPGEYLLRYKPPGISGEPLVNVLSLTKEETFRVQRGTQYSFQQLR